MEGFFAKLTRKRLRRGSFRGIVDFQAAFHRSVKEHNRTATSKKILAKVKKALAALAGVASTKR